MENSKSNGKAWVVVAFFTIFMAVYNFNLVVYSACALETMEFYGISQAGITTFSSVVSLVGLLGGLIFGPIIDRKGSRNIVTIGLVAAVVLFAVRAFVGSYVLALILTFLASFFFGVCQVDAPKILDTWYTKENVGTAVAFQSGGAGVGAAVAFAIGAKIGLQNTLLVVAGATLVLLIFWFLAGHDGPIEVEHVELPKNATAQVYKSKFVWLISIAYACCVSATMTINTYIINAFASTGRVTADQASLMGTLLTLSLFFGGYLGTFMMHMLKRYNVVLAICVLGGAVGYLLCWFLPTGPQTWIFLVLGGLIMGGGIMLCVSRSPLIPFTGEIPFELVGTAAAALEVIKGVISFVLPLIIANLFGTNFNAVFISFAVLCGVAFLTGSVLVPEVGPAGKLFKEAEANKNK